MLLPPFYVESLAADFTALMFHFQTPINRQVHIYQYREIRIREIRWSVTPYIGCFRVPTNKRIRKTLNSFSTDREREPTRNEIKVGASNGDVISDLRQP
jgi:hypothetical protein